MIANPFGYNKESTLTLVVMSSATAFVWLIHLPIMVCHYFVLFPDDMQATLERLGYPGAFEHFIKAKVFPYNPSKNARSRYCERHWVQGSKDATIIVLFIFVLNCLAISLIAVAYVVISVIIVRSRKTFGDRGDDEQAARQRKRSQNKKLALRAFFITFCTLFPWLPNLLVSILNRILTGYDIGHKLNSNKAYLTFMDITIYLYFIIPWVSPLLNLVLEPKINSGLKSLLKDGFR